MSKLVGIKVNNYVVEYVKGGKVYLKEVGNELNHVAVDMTAHKVINARVNGRNYKSDRFLKKYNYLITLLDTIIDLYEPPVEEQPRPKVFRRPADLIQDILIGGRI